MQTATTSNQPQFRIRINQFIRVPEVRVIGSDDLNKGIMATHEALKLAQEEGLDLVEINPRAVPPVVKIVNFGRFKYEEKKKAQADKKKQVVQELKEITLRPNIADNDLNHKAEQAKSFLAEGNKVKLTVRFRGREVTHTHIGKDKLEAILKALEGLIQPNPPISLDGKLMSVLVMPTKKA